MCEKELKKTCDEKWSIIPRFIYQLHDKLQDIRDKNWIIKRIIKWWNDKSF